MITCVLGGGHLVRVHRGSAVAAEERLKEQPSRHLGPLCAVLSRGLGTDTAAMVVEQLNGHRAMCTRVVKHSTAAGMGVDLVSERCNV